MRLKGASGAVPQVVNVAAGVSRVSKSPFLDKVATRNP
jgi:hypothetical protein